MRTYSFNSVKLCLAYTMDELLALKAEVDADPANLNPPGHVYLKNARGRRRSDAVAWAIYHKLCETNPPKNVDGYSGRQTNRRR